MCVRRRPSISTALCADRIAGLGRSMTNNYEPSLLTDPLSAVYRVFSGSIYNIRRCKMVEVSVTPLLVRKEPGDPQFHEYLNQGRKIARTLQVGTELIYTGPDTYKFVDWAPIPHGARVTVVGHIPCKSAVTCRFPDGTLVGLNIYSLAWPGPQGDV